MKRKPTPISIETAIFKKSGRRCALCFVLLGDLTEKRGQIAHLDKDPANSTEDNLAYLCLEHHSLYDSKTSQHKNYTMPEVKSARAELYEVVATGKHLASANSLVRRDWRAETIGKRRIELAEEAIDLFSQLPGAFLYVRNPFSFSNEGKTIAQTGESVNVDHVALERLQKCDDLFGRVQAIRHKFIAYFGDESRASFDVVERTRREILAAAHSWRLCDDVSSRKNAESIRRGRKRC